MNRFERISGALLAPSVFLTFKVVAAEANKPQPPNILFILVDDLAYADVNCYGAEKIQTPNTNLKYTSL